MTIRDLTPKAMRCGPRNCPSIHQLEDGSLLIVGKVGYPMVCREGISTGLDETAIIIDPALLDDVPRGWRTIDSAPRDGTMILALIKGAPPLMLPMHWRDGYWWDDIDRGFGDAVTHWLPLPLPPTDREGA